MQSTASAEITEIRAYPIREPRSARSYAIVEVRTKSGLSGFGECRAVTAPDLATARAYWIGRPATAYAVVGPHTGLSGAVEMALLDITGKLCHAPVYRVLGGPTRAKVRVLTSVALSDVERAAAAGHRAFSIAGGMPANSRYDYVIEPAEPLTPGRAASLARTLEKMHPLWLDEPCAVSNLETIRKIAEETVTPLGFGRSLREPGQFQELLRAGLIDVVRPDLCWHGITRIRRIAAMAETYYVAVAPGHAGGPIGTAAALQLAATLPNFFIQHIPFATRRRYCHAVRAGRRCDRNNNRWIRRAAYRTRSGYRSESCRSGEIPCIVGIS